MTVDPRLQLTPGEYLIHPDGSASKVVDKRNLTVDEILAHGRYTDRRGREWRRSEFLPRWVTPSGFNYFGEVYAFVYEDEMRLLIERDMHRDVCLGLSRCRNHPVPRATYCDVNGFDILSAGEVTVAEFARPCHATLPEAIDAARALAVANE